MDLRSYLMQLEATSPNQLVRIRDPVSVYYEMSAVAFEYIKRKNSCLLFEKLRESDMPLVANIFGSKERIALALGVPVEAIYDSVFGRMKENSRPKLVEDGPVKEVKVEGSSINLERLLPIPRWFEQDAGRYITAGLVVAKNMVDGVTNLTFARMQLKGRDKFGISFHSRGNQFNNLQRAREAGKPLEIAVVIGGHPVLHLAAGARIVDEYSVASALLGEPIELTRCETVDLEVPARAEIVLEGEVSTNLEENEGPFSEYTGYLSGRSTRNVLRIKAVTHRRNPIFLGVLPNNSPEHILLSNITREARTLRSVKDFLPVAKVKAANWPIPGVRFVSFIALEKPIPGVAKQAALLTLGVDLYLKLVVITDASVDVTDFEQVLKAIAKNAFHNGRGDFEIVDGVFCNLLDPSSRDGMQSKMLIDATTKKEVITKNSPQNKLEMERVKKISGIEDIRFPRRCEGLVAYVKAVDTDAKQLGNTIFESAPNCRIVIIVDPDIDLDNSDEVLWSIATRVAPRDDVLALSADGGILKLIIDSRKAQDFSGVRPTVPLAIEEKAKELVAKYIR